ncbi:hypothetical protein D3C80_846750 [compost metagenome]
MKDRRAPALFQPGYVGQLIGNAHGKDQPGSTFAAATVDLYDEIAKRPFGIGHPALRPLYRLVTLDLAARFGDDLARRLAVLAEKTVGVAGKAVPSFTGIHDKNVLPGAAKLQCGGETGIAAADDDDVEFHDAPIVQGRAGSAHSFSRYLYCYVIFRVKGHATYIVTSLRN